MLKSSAGSLSKALVTVDDPPSTTTNSGISEISKTYSNIRPSVDDKDILVWHARLGHLSFPAIKWLPNAVKGIQFHAKTPSTCICEARILENMFRKPFQPFQLEDKSNTQRFQLIHFDVMGQMQAQTMNG